MGVENIRFESGYFIVKTDIEEKRIPVSKILRALDIPDLTIDSLTLLTKLADVLIIIVKTLIERQILDEDFEDNYDLQYIVDTLKDDINADW